MEFGEKLLKLNAAYNEAIHGEIEGAQFPGVRAGRAPSDIAAEYEATLREMFAK